MRTRTQAQQRSEASGRRGGRLGPGDGRRIVDNIRKNSNVYDIGEEEDAGPGGGGGVQGGYYPQGPIRTSPNASPRLLAKRRPSYGSGPAPNFPQQQQPQLQPQPQHRVSVALADPGAPGRNSSPQRPGTAGGVRPGMGGRTSSVSVGNVPNVSASSGGGGGGVGGGGGGPTPIHVEVVPAKPGRGPATFAEMGITAGKAEEKECRVM
jgi:hypothetical protein